MRVLLDTQVFLWAETDRDRFSPASIELLEDTANDLVLSAAVSWEIAVKYVLGKIDLPSPPHEYIPNRMTRGDFAGLAIEHTHAVRVAALPAHHRDPFDRILIAQAQVERLPILTADRRFDLYDVEIVWAK